MTFPVTFNLFGSSIHAHNVLEVLGYAAAAQTYFFVRRRQRETVAPAVSTALMIIGAIFGAVIGSKLLAIIESWQDYWANRTNIIVWLQGKTIVGGLLGAWIGVEIAKRGLRIRLRTGDQYVLPLCIGIAIGRVGCFLEGLADHTHGIATALPWGVDFGDGIRRHPTQLYESIFVLFAGLIIAIALKDGGPNRAGAKFRVFMLAYLVFRLLVEFIKPTYKPWLGLSAIQIASAIGCAVCVIQLIYQYAPPIPMVKMPHIHQPTHPHQPGTK